jgi:transposase
MSGCYLGIDAHSTTGLELVALSARDGELLWRDRCPLKRRPLLAAVARAPRPCVLVFEQGELATWLHQTLDGSTDRLLVANPTHNRMIANSPHKGDTFDATTLARLAQGGYIHEVYQPPAAFCRLRLLVRHQRRMGVHVVRLKNQIKALYRQHGLVPQGAGVYVSGRQQWLQLLPDLAQDLVADHYLQLDATLEGLQATKDRIEVAARKFPPVVRLCSIPQVGPLTAATFVAYVVTPERFGSRKKLWTYCGFGLMQRSSGASFEPMRLRKDRNVHLKRVLKMAVVRICQRPEHPLYAAYQAKRAQGMADHKAKLTIARRLINTMAAIWSHKQEFDATQVAIA